MEGIGLGVRGRVSETGGDLRLFRAALDGGNYVRVGELSPDSPEETLASAYTVKAVRERISRRRAARNA